MLFDMMETSRRLLNNEGHILITSGYLVMLRAPAMTEKIMPFSAYIAAIFTFYRLNRYHEFVVMRAAGVSIWQLLAPLVAIAIVIGLFKITILNYFSSSMLLKYEIAEALYIKNSNLIILRKGGIWFRHLTNDGHYILHARDYKSDQGRFNKVTVFLLEDGDHFSGRIDADTAKLEGSYWRLDGAVFSQPNKPPQYFNYKRLQTKLTSDNINQHFSTPEAISFVALPGFIKALENAGFSAVRYKLQWHKMIAEMLGLSALVILASIFSLRPTRGAAGRLIAPALGIGFLAYALSQACYSLGLSSQIPVIIAAWCPTLVIASFAATILLHLEDG